MVQSETAGRQAFSRGLFREQDRSGHGLFRSPEQGGVTERYQVSGVNDPEEIRAEQTADQVMGGLFRGADARASGGGDGIFREASAPGAEGGPAELSSADLSEPGSALPSDLQQSMGESMGTDFSDVRVHTGPGADRASEQISARAFTRGRDVYFRDGAYDPSSQEGQHLIAHELAHVASGAEGLHRVPDWWRRLRGQGAQPASGTPGQTSGTQNNSNANQQNAQSTVDPNAAVDVMTASPGSLIKEQAPRVEEWAAGKKTAFEGAVNTQVLEGLKKKYVAKTEAATETDMSADKIKADEMGQQLDDMDKYIKKLDEGAKGKGVVAEIKTAYQSAKTSLETAVNGVRKDIVEVGKNVNEGLNATRSAPVSDAVKAMVKDPAFEKFKDAVNALRTSRASGGNFEIGEEASKNNMGSKSAGVSLESKQRAAGLKVTGKRGETLSKVSQGLSAVGGAASELGESAGGLASATTDHIEGGKIDEKFKGLDELKKKKEEAEADAEAAQGNEKKKTEAKEAAAKFEENKKAKAEAEEAAAKTASDRAEAAQGITEGVGETMAGIGGAVDTFSNSREAAIQRKQDMNAKNAMRAIAKQLERTVPAGVLGNASEERHKRIKAVCDRVKGRKFSGTGEDDGMTDLISGAMEDGIQPNLTVDQKRMLENLQMLEASRSSSKNAAKKMRKEAVFSSMDAFGSLLRGAGSITSGLGGILGSSIAGIVGAVLSLVGAIFGKIGAVRSAMSSEEGEGSEEDETQRKMEASKGAIKQMAQLPELAPAEWTDITAAGKGERASPVHRDKMDIAEQYAGVFFSIQASNVNISDILYAVEKGEFGKDLGGGQTKSAEDSMKDMYENLSMS